MIQQGDFQGKHLSTIGKMDPPLNLLQEENKKRCGKTVPVTWQTGCRYQTDNAPCPWTGTRNEGGLGYTGDALLLPLSATWQFAKAPTSWFKGSAKIASDEEVQGTVGRCHLRWVRTKEPINSGSSRRDDKVPRSANAPRERRSLHSSPSDANHRP
jgi:hypothetical protein